MADFPDPPDVRQIVESAADDRYGRRMAVVIVLVTLAAATTAWLQAGSGRDDNEAAVRAERLASQSLGTTVRADALGDLRVQRESLAAERGRRASSLERSLAYGVGDLPVDRALIRGWRRAARATERTTERIATAEGIPAIAGAATEDSDPAFPSVYLTEAGREGQRLGSIRDAANREGDRAEEQIGSYGVALTIFAVAVFLFGYSLTPYGRRNRRLLASAGSVMTAVGLLMALLTTLDGPDRAPDEAAASYADAVVASASDREGEALDSLERALESRPKFPAALIARGQLRAGIAGGSFDELPALVGAGDGRLAAADFERALELDDDDVDALLGLASVELVVGLRGDPDAAERAVGAAEDAIEIDPVGPSARYLLALALLTRDGDPGDADYLEALAAAGKRTATADDGERARDEGGRRELVASALSLIALGEESGVIASGDAEAASESVVMGAWPDVGPPRPDANAEPSEATGDREEAFERLRLGVDPAGFEVSWPADRPGGSRGGADAFDAGRDTLSVFLYATDADGDEVVVPEVSGPVGDRELFFDGARTAFVKRSRLDLTIPARCLPAGDYRVEAYVDGKLASSATAANELSTDGAYSFDEQSLVACMPAGWKPLEGDGAVIDGIVSPDGSRGLVATRVPRAAAPGRGRAATMQALEAGFAQIEAELPEGIEQRTRTRQPFLDATTAPSLIVRTKGGGAVASAGRQSQGGIAVGAVFGPEAFFGGNGRSSSDALDLFRSLRDRF